MQIKREEELDGEAEGEGQGKEGQEAGKGQLNTSNLSGGGGGYKPVVERRPVKQTASLAMLQGSRASRVEREVEDEFKQMAADKKAKATGASPKPTKNST